jgi:hypothetical protein
MPIIKKFAPRENLETFSTFITTNNDTDAGSVYFRISELNPTLTGGKNGFLIEGSPHLKETTEIKIEILDVNGNTVYFEPGKGIPDYYEGLSKVVSVHIYPDTPIGVGKMTVMGELKTYIDDDGVERGIPDEWKGIYNVKWETDLKINRNLPNEDKVRFYRRPTIEIDEIVKPVFNTQIPTVIQTGVVSGFSIIPESQTLLDNFTDPTFYRLTISGSETWTGSVIGSDIVVDTTPPYIATVLDVVNTKDITVSPPYSIDGRVAELPNTSYTVQFLNRDGRENTDSPLSGSFAKITIKDLKTFVGDVVRVKVFRRSESSIGDFEFTQEIELESNELLIDFDAVGKVQEKFGLLTEPIIEEYWDSSSLSTTFNQDVLFNSVNFTPDGVGQFFTKNEVQFNNDVEYTVSFGVRLSGSFDNGDYLKVFTSGSNENQLFLNLTASDILKEKRTVSQNIIAQRDENVRLVFEIVGNGWFVNNISLRASQETAFSPDEITFIQSVPRLLQSEIFEYKFEFYDINNNLIPVKIGKTKEFTGGNTTLITRGLEVIPSNQFFTYDAEGNSTGLAQILFDIRRNLLTGSVSFVSSAFAPNGDLIDESDYSSGQYPGLLINQTDSSAVLTSANFTGSRDDIDVQYIVYEASCEDQIATVLIAKIEDGRSGLGAGFIESTAVSFVRKDDKTFTPPSASITAFFRDREDFQTPITASIIAYPSYSFDGGIDRNFIWYESDTVNPSINVEVFDSTSSIITEGEVNASQTDTAVVRFTFTDSIGDVISTQQSLSITSDGDKGDDTVRIDLTPSNFVFSKNEQGIVQNFNEGTTLVRVLQGNNALKYDQELSEAGTWATQSINPNNISIGSIDDIDESTLQISGLSSLQSNLGTIEYNLIARPEYVNQFNTASVEIETTQAFTSIRDGSNSRLVRLFSSAYDVVYDADYPQSGVSPINPIGAITLTAFQFNHTGSVFYEFYNNGILEFGPSTTNQLVIPSGEMPQPEEISVWEVRTRENTSVSVEVARDSLDIVGRKNGRDARDISISFTPSFFKFTSSFDSNPIINEVTASIVTKNIPTFTTSSISFRSGSTTDFVSWDDFFLGKSNIPTLDQTNNIYNFVIKYDDHISSRGNLPLTVRAQQTVFGQTIGDNISIDFVDDGDDGLNGEDAPPIYRAEIIRGSNVTVPISVFGTPNFSGSGVTIVGYKDEVALTGSLSAPTSTQYSASIFDKSTFITTGTPTIVSNEVVFGDITNWDLPTINRNGFVTYKVTFDGNIDRFVTQRLNTTSDGETGPGIVFRGEWTGSVDYKFQENNRRDAVLFDKNGDGTPEMYYATLQPSGPSTRVVAPSGSNYESIEEGSGSITVTGNIVSGDNTFFVTQVGVGDYLYTSDYILIGEIDSVIDDSLLELVTSTGDLPSGTTYLISTELLPFEGNPADYWEELGEEDFFVAAKIAIFEESFVKNTLNVGTPSAGGSEAGIVINGRDSESTYISIGQPVIGFQQTGIFQGVSGSSNQTPYLSLQSATGSNGEYRSLEWDGSTLTIRGALRQTAAGIVVTESINRGTWESGSIYEIGNIVQYGEIGLPTASYSAIQDHTASFSNNPPSASFWSVFAVGQDGAPGLPGPGVVYRGEWTTGSEYVRTDERRDVVFYETSGDNYWIAKQTHTSISSNEPPDADFWEPFGATFTSIATSFILTEDAVATRSISVGENAAITIFGSGSSPYISIGQANGSQGFNQTGIFAGIVNDTGSLSLKSATDVVSWNGNDFNISGSNSSLVISGLGGETRIEGGKLTTIDGVFQGRIDACAGSVGGFNIESGFLTSCNNRILIDGANNIISINDINDSTKFIANTDISLPSTQASETGTLFLTSSTDSISCNATLPYIGSLPTTATASLGILTPENTAEYSIIWRNTTADNIYACATGPNTSAQAGIRLRVECTNGYLINETNIQSVTVSGGSTECGFDQFSRTYYNPTTQCAILPNNTFNLKANLASGSAYCVNVVKIGGIEHGGAETNPDGNVIPSCTSVSIPITAQTTASYSATPSYTLINGGGFQSVVDTGEYLRVGKKGQFSETVRVEGSIQLQGTDINNRFIRFIPKSTQTQFWIVNSLGDESFITGSGTVGGLLFGRGERPGCVPPSTGWGTGTPLMNLTPQGNLILTGSVSSQGNFSDYNLKDNLTVIDSPINKVTAINGYTYTWNSASYTPGKLDGGVVAQEVECILPSLVGTTTIDNTEYKTVSYNGIIGLLVESVKELSSEICSLKTELACIKSTII